MILNLKNGIEIINSVNPCIAFGWYLSDVEYKRNVKTNSTVMPQFRSYV